MKRIYLVLLALLPYFTGNSYAQNAQEEKQWAEILQTADTTALITFLRQFEPWRAREPWEPPFSGIEHMQGNDTALAANAVMRSVLYTYGTDQLAGVSRYKDYTQWPNQIIIQPEVEVCFVSTPEVDYRGVFAGKYIYHDILSMDEWWDMQDTGSRLDNYLPYYNAIPDLTKCKKYPYQRLTIDDGYITMDTLSQIRLEKFVLDRIDQLDCKKINAVIPIGFGRITWGKNKGKPFSSLSYNIWIDKIIFNPQLDQCLVQASTWQAAYEIFLLKINDRWIIAHNVEWMHLD